MALRRLTAGTLLRIESAPGIPGGLEIRRREDFATRWRRERQASCHNKKLCEPRIWTCRFRVFLRKYLSSPEMWLATATGYILSYDLHTSAEDNRIYHFFMD
jgi:hypothetical protein